MVRKLVVPLFLFSLAACQTTQRYTIEAPRPGSPPAHTATRPVAQKPPVPVSVGTAGPLSAAGIGRYMDGLERDLRHILKGTPIARPGDVLAIDMRSDALFESGVALSERGRDTLKDLAAALRHYDRTLVQVNGHTDARGSPDRNLAVSQRRADAVAAELRAEGVDARRIAATGLGSAHLKVATGAGVAEARNRRIEIRVIPHPG